MGEIKTDMFPEVLRMKAKEKQENGKKNRQECVQSNVVISVEAVSESPRKGNGGQGIE